MPEYEYVCPRCSYSTNDIRCFKNHLNRQYICKPIVSRINLDDLKKKYNIVKSANFICDNCDKEFCSRSGFNTHKKKCNQIKSTPLVLQSLYNIESAIVKIAEQLNINFQRTPNLVAPQLSPQLAPQLAPQLSPQVSQPTAQLSPQLAPQLSPQLSPDILAYLSQLQQLQQLSQQAPAQHYVSVSASPSPPLPLTTLPPIIEKRLSFDGLNHLGNNNGNTQSLSKTFSTVNMASTVSNVSTVSTINTENASANTSAAPSKILFQPETNFGQEDLLYIYNDIPFMRSCFQEYEKGIVKFMERVWFDKDNPINMNFKFIDNKTVAFYYSKKWNKASWSDHITKLLDYTGVYLQQFLEIHSIFDERFLNNYMKQIGIYLDWDLSHGDYDYNESATHSSVSSNSNTLLIDLKKEVFKKLYNAFSKL